MPIIILDWFTIFYTNNIIALNEIKSQTSNINHAANQNITFSATASVTRGAVYYQFGYKPNYGSHTYASSGWTQLQDWSTSSTCTTSFPQTGNYIITVEASNQAGYPVSGTAPVMGGSLAVTSGAVTAQHKSIDLAYRPLMKRLH